MNTYATSAPVLHDTVINSQDDHVHLSNAYPGHLTSIRALDAIPQRKWTAYKLCFRVRVYLWILRDYVGVNAKQVIEFVGGNQKTFSGMLNCFERICDSFRWLDDRRATLNERGRSTLDMLHVLLGDSWDVPPADALYGVDLDSATRAALKLTVSQVEDINKAVQTERARFL